MLQESRHMAVAGSSGIVVWNRTKGKGLSSGRSWSRRPRSRGERHSGRGLGRIILRRLLLEAREWGVGSVFLEVRADNFAAINLYISEKFERIGLRPGYYQQDGADAISMKSAIVEPRLETGVKNV